MSSVHAYWDLSDCMLAIRDLSGSQFVDRYWRLLPRYPRMLKRFVGGHLGPGFRVQSAQSIDRDVDKCPEILQIPPVRSRKFHWRVYPGRGFPRVGSPIPFINGGRACVNLSISNDVFFGSHIC